MPREFDIIILASLFDNRANMFGCSATNLSVYLLPIVYQGPKTCRSLLRYMAIVTIGVTGSCLLFFFKNLLITHVIQNVTYVVFPCARDIAGAKTSRNLTAV